MNPLCPKCNSLLARSDLSNEVWEIYNCPTCTYCNANLIGEWLPTDYDTNNLFHEVALKLSQELNISCKEAIEIVFNYYTKFTDITFCQSIGLPVQDDDFFHHEGVAGLVLRAVYYLVQKNDPNPSEYLNWRSNVIKKA